jgi:hypothetical protein
MIASADEFESVIASSPSQGPASPSELPGAISTPVRSGANGGYGRAAAAAHALHPSLHDEAFEEPVSGERIAPTRPMNGSLFAYPNGIPFPAAPPRPDLDAALRVTPAPRPGRSGH